jgi:hypothetical protein
VEAVAVTLLLAPQVRVEAVPETVAQETLTLVVAVAALLVPAQPLVVTVGLVWLSFGIPTTSLSQLVEV